MLPYHKYYLLGLFLLFINGFTAETSAQDSSYIYANISIQEELESRRLAIPEGLTVGDVSLIPKDVEKLSLEDVSEFLLSDNSAEEEVFQWRNQTAGKDSYLVFSVPRILNTDSGWVYLKTYSLDVSYSKSKSKASSYKSGLIDNSILASGNWFKYAVVKDGIYKLSYERLLADGVISGSVISSKLKVYGNGFGMMSFQNNDGRPIGLGFAPFKIVDGGDGVFQAGDYVLFYGNGPNNIVYDFDFNVFKNQNNSYDNSNYYFVGLNDEVFNGIPAVDLPAQSILNDAIVRVAAYDKDVVNVARSGRTMYGDELSTGASVNLNLSVLGEAKPNTLSEVYFEAAGNVNSGSFNFNVTINGEEKIFSSGSSGQYTAARVARGVFNAPSGNNYAISSVFSGNGSDANGWLGQIVVAKQVYFEAQTINEPYYLNPELYSSDTVSFTLRNYTNQEIWEISTPFKAKKIVVNNNGLGQAVLTSRADTVQKFIVVDDNGNYPSPGLVGKVVNQNLHALSSDYIIVVQNGLRSEAERLATFHRSRGLSVEVVNPQLIYNEFGSGAKDVTAIKDFMRHLYNKWKAGDGVQPKYLLLFGDGSYVNKGTTYLTNANFLPTYQSENSTNLINSYVSDDYFAFLDENEGEATSDLMDIAVGRFPVSTLSDAKICVDKVISYTNQKGLINDLDPGDWRNRITFITDDMDGETNADGITHMLQANNLAKKVEQNYPNYYTKRIFLDAFKQVTTSGGERYPDANKEIKESVNDGALFVNYTGHGGVLGWAHERILDVSTILSWDNYKRMPIMVTATCEFSRFDDPGIISAGEYTILNPKGGVVALMTTNRVVYASENFRLNNYFYDYALPALNTNERLRLGDIFRLAKVAYSAAVGVSSLNHMNFILLGDPALEITYPKQNVVTTHINNVEVDNVVDTLSALSLLNIKGEIQDQSNVKLTDFNGVVYVKIFDKPKQEKTLGNDGKAGFSYEARSTVLYNGQASVNNGEFQIELILPKDVSFEDSTAYINYYAVSETTDANGIFDRFTVSAATTPSADVTGPDIDLFLNDFEFISGDITNNTPMLLANLFDESGINTAGNGIGHDIAAIIDEQGAKPIVLNTYYKAALDTYKEGSLVYQLPEIEPGVHTLTLRAWDVANNPSEKTIQFIVEDPNSIIVDDFSVYPNPTAGAVNFKFTHNQAQNLNSAQIDVYDISGRKVQSLYKNLQNETSQNTIVPWDGKNAEGNNIKNGLYVYKFVLSDSNGNDLVKEGRISIIQ